MQGQGNGTALKEERLRNVLVTGFNAFEKAALIHPRAKFIYIDTNAGSGYNENVGVWGSPLVAMNALREGLGEGRYFGILIEKDEKSAEELKWWLHFERHARRSYSILNLDNNIAIRDVPNVVNGLGENPRYAIGFCFCDANGLKGVPMEGLKVLSLACPRIDICVNHCSRVQKLLEKNHEKFGHNIEKYEMQRDIPSHILKNYWSVSDFVGSHRFAFLLGRNVKLGHSKRWGVYSVETPKGAEIFNRITQQARL